MDTEQVNLSDEDTELIEYQERIKKQKLDKKRTKKSRDKQAENLMRKNRRNQVKQAEKDKQEAEDNKRYGLRVSDIEFLMMEKPSYQEMIQPICRDFSHEMSKIMPLNKLESLDISKYDVVDLKNHNYKNMNVWGFDTTIIRDLVQSVIDQHELYETHLNTFKVKKYPNKPTRKELKNLSFNLTCHRSTRTNTISMFIII